MSEEKAGYGLVTKRTMTTYTPGDDAQNWIGDIVEESAALCSVELGETAPAEKGVVQIKSVKVYGYTAREAGDAAQAEIDRLRALRDGRVSVSRETAEVACGFLEGRTMDLAGTEVMLQELRTVLAGFTVAKP